MAAPQILIIGGGIAGPVLGLHLKLRGYEPIVYERLHHFVDLGVGLLLQPNGLKVLSFIPGLLESIDGGKVESLISYSTLPEDEGLLGRNDVPTTFSEKYGSPMMGVRRTTLHASLVAACEKHGVEVKWDHQCTAFEQHEDSVTATFANGETAAGSFLIGCDGLHSVIRIGLFGKETASYTGLTQAGGVCSTPASLRKPPAMTNFYGNGGHMITYPINDKECSWALTLREEEHPETWHAASSNILQKIKDSPQSTWAFGAGDLIKATDKVVKYGLYDRPQLTSWHKDRVVLLGDAAHPTSPHLGQGANQAFEDIYHLTAFLDELNLSREALPTSELAKVFKAYENKRIERTSLLVKKAREQGNSRVVSGVEKCKERDEVYRQSLTDGGHAQSEVFAAMYADSLGFKPIPSVPA
ncbi:FAD/NAD(P)-binding domain-containing protein [Peniophora sp. CONT]|nr:FAD/NAD(P)-binding domain-containing protein [Peniophora sp. CONT]